MRLQLISFGLAVRMLWVTLATVRACGLDGVPSLKIDGHLVVANRSLPAHGQLSRWAPFVAPDLYPLGVAISFQEITGRVLVTLPPSAFRTPWRWTFGDGTRTTGPHARHTYRRPGTYVVGVSAYLLNGKHSQWYQFDTALIHVR